MLALLLAGFVSCVPVILDRSRLEQGRERILANLYAFRACGSRHAVRQKATSSNQRRDVSVDNRTYEGRDISR